LDVSKALYVQATKKFEVWQPW